MKQRDVEPFLFALLMSAIVVAGYLVALAVTAE